MKRILVWTFILGVLIPQPAKAQFGFGIGEALTLLKILGINTQQLTQAVHTASGVINTYDQVKRNAESLKGLQYRYRTLPGQWRTYYTRDIFGNLQAWSNAANTGDYGGSDSAYKQASITLRRLGIGNVPDDEAERIRSHYASIELMDGAVPNALSVIGQARGNGIVNDGQISNYTDDALSDDDSQTTTNHLLKKTGAIAATSASVQSDQLKVQTAIAEMHAIEMKRQRDGEAEAINTQAARQEDRGEGVNSSVRGGSSIVDAQDPTE